MVDARGGWVYVCDMLLTSAAAAVQILSNAMKALNAVRERAKGSQDTDLKTHINTLYDELLTLKEVVVRLTDENAELKRTQTTLAKLEPELRQVGSANFYFDGDKGPYCQPCYDRDKKLTMLTPPENWNGGVRRHCVLCGVHFYEQPMQLNRLNVRRKSFSQWS